MAILDKCDFYVEQRILRMVIKILTNNARNQFTETFCYLHQDIVVIVIFGHNKTRGPGEGCDSNDDWRVLETGVDRTRICWMGLQRGMKDYHWLKLPRT